MVADPDVIYLDGNSLGRLPATTPAHLERVIREEWGEDLIRSWPGRWWEQSERIGDAIAEIAGAGAGNVILSDSTSTSLFKLAFAALQARPGRTTILTDDLNFPSDNYLLQSVADLLGRRVTVIRSTDGIHGPVTEIEAALDDDVALVSLSHVSFKSGYMYDMERVTRAAHAAGALVLWDVSHSVGVVPLRLLDDHVDLAVGCTYKYLNGGPGSPAFLFAHPSLVNDLTNPIPGWWAHREPFAFDLEFAPESGIRRLLTGTMPILSLSALEPALPIVLDAGIDTIRAKSVALTEYFVELVDARLTDLGFTLTTPHDPGRRGSHIAVRHDDGWRITRAMIEHGRVIPDFRDPDNIRFGLVPLYTTFTELEIAVGRICDLVARGAHLRYANTRTVVT